MGRRVDGKCRRGGGNGACKGKGRRGSEGEMEVRCRGSHSILQHKARCFMFASHQAPSYANWKSVLREAAYWGKGCWEEEHQRVERGVGGNIRRVRRTWRV